jgi:hypothetical protein
VPKSGRGKELLAELGVEEPKNKPKGFSDRITWDSEMGSYVPIDSGELYDQAPNEAREWAKYQYFTGKMSVGELAEHSGIPTWMLAKWVHGTRDAKGWAQERKEAEQRALAGATRRYSQEFSTLIDKLLVGLHKTADKLVDENYAPNIPEFQKIVASTKDLFMMEQLRTGKPTENSYNMNIKITRESLVAKLKEVDIIDYPELAVVSDAAAGVTAKSLPQPVIELSLPQEVKTKEPVNVGQQDNTGNPAGPRATR